MHLDIMDSLRRTLERLAAPESTDDNGWKNHGQIAKMLSVQLLHEIEAAPKIQWETDAIKICVGSQCKSCGMTRCDCEDPRAHEAIRSLEEQNQKLRKQNAIMREELTGRAAMVVDYCCEGCEHAVRHSRETLREADAV